MKEEFNFEHEVGRLAQCVANKEWFGIKEPLKNLAAHPQHEDAIATLVNTVDYLKENAGEQFTLYLVDEMLDGMKQPKTIEESYVQAKLVEKWAEIVDAGAANQPESTLSYLTSTCRHMTDDHPLSAKALPQWEKLVDSQWPLKDIDIDCTLSVDYDVKNAGYRHAALKRLALLKEAEPDRVLRLLTETIDRGGFYSFRDSDKESVQLMALTMTDILEAQKEKLDDKKQSDLAWKIIASCEGADADAEKKAARIYLDVASRQTNTEDAFNMYRSLMGRKNAHIPDESREAALKILDIADAGTMPKGYSDHSELTRCVSDEIFAASIAEETKDASLAARSATTLLKMVRDELTKPDARGAYQYYNGALMLYGHFALSDPRTAEVKKVWEDALTKNYGAGDDYYARQMGWMLDTATEKGDSAMAAKAKKAWRDSIEATAKKFPHEAYNDVQKIIVNKAHYKPDSALLAEARAVFPDLEQRAGVKKVPETMGSGDFLKMIGKKKDKGFKP